ncbi:MAG: hypothetical protein AMDU4_FER2C00018G0005 [Ferroplasma sp. Type II]|uniref:hypothetical protein n=1 Tax=Ferroplasma sp. Type II TaxID=261388 RepID=UPI00038951D1|nr:hypothetical protein [Ferroplasma sp. Type II]EQB74241.1 MAG: hypothetical protein AMDU4_FER2C00018G0005 [Ferroplasma sp. Type II]
MSIAGNLNVAHTLAMTTTSGQVITFTGQGGAYIGHNLNFHFPNATSTYTWNITNGSTQLLTLGIGVGNAGDLSIAGGLTISGQVAHNGFTPQGLGIAYIIDTGGGTYSNGLGDFQLWSFYNGGNYMLRISYFYYVDSFSSTGLSLPSLNVSATDLSGNRYTETFLNGNNIGEGTWQTKIGFVYAEGGTTTNRYVTGASGTYTINYGYAVELLQI